MIVQLRHMVGPIDDSPVEVGPIGGTIRVDLVNITTEKVGSTEDDDVEIGAIGGRALGRS